jgi:hypothetical protein
MRELSPWSKSFDGGVKVPTPFTRTMIAAPHANRTLRSVEVRRDDFVRLATESRAELGKRFDPIRWFCGEDELLRVGGRT